MNCFVQVQLYSDRAKLQYYVDYERNLVRSLICLFITILFTTISQGAYLLHLLQYYRRL